ncbi:MAG: hypothetical protein IPN71_00170 [Fibrobacteres bacterium]|nr:hypothetical protein [Fibrobacterota bacterium]
MFFTLRERDFDQLSSSLIGQVERSSALRIEALGERRVGFDPHDDWKGRMFDWIPMLRAAEHHRGGVWRFQHGKTQSGHLLVSEEIGILE